MAASLCAEAVDAGVTGTIFSSKVQIFPTIGSTNTFAMQQGHAGAPHGSVYVAEEQTAGRGRGAHTWHSEPHSGLYLSLIVRPDITPADALWLSLATGLAVQSAVENITGMIADIRWPNDMLLRNLKFGGILTEMSAENVRVRHAVIGIGLNVNHTEFHSELRELATSLHLESGQIICRQKLLIAVLQAMDEELRKLLETKDLSSTTRDIRARLEERSTWIRNKHVAVEEAGGYTGVTAGLTTNGFLQVQTNDGLRTVISGGVRGVKG